jgi:hypothetical protein
VVPQPALAPLPLDRGIAIAASVAIVLFERVVGWPDWLRTEPVPVRRM